MVRIAVVVLDTLRKDAFDNHFEWLPGQRFEQAWSTSHWTVPAHASLFCGHYPTELGVHAGSPTLSTRTPTIAERLTEEGFQTAAFSCNPYVSSQFGFDRGFDTFEGSWRLRMFDENLFDWNRFVSKHGSTGISRFPRALLACIRSDCDTGRSLRFGANLTLRDHGYGAFQDDGVSEAISWLSSHPHPETDSFLFVNLMEAHAPYLPPPAYRTGGASDPDMISATLDPEYDLDARDVEVAYEDSVRYLSDMYRELFSQLQEQFDVIVTLSDHGELFGEHGTWGHWHGLFPELTHIPLIITGLNECAYASDDPVNLLDLFSTLADLAGVGYDDTRGRSLFSSPTETGLLTEYHGLQTRMQRNLATEEYSDSIIKTYDRELHGIALPDCYGYETTGGFEEVGDCSDSHTVLESLRESLSRPDGADLAEHELPESVIKQLKNLGYA
jgi:arylsulfatase A-like enzyme